MTIRRGIYVEDGKMHFHAVQDADAIFEANKFDANHSSNYSPSKDLKHVARIPLIVAEHWLYEYGVDVFNLDHRDAVTRLLNDKDWYFLRTGGGTL